MDPHRRQDAILQRLGDLPAGQELSVEQLAAEFAVNAVTIRRDLAGLQARGLLRRTRGGAVSSRSGRIEFQFARRQQTNLAEKAAIADIAVAMIQPGCNVSLDTGTTTLEVARRLPALARLPSAGLLKVLTSSLAIAAELYRFDAIDLVLLGGSVRKDSPDMVGPLTEENLARFRVHVAFLGADSATPDGLFTTDANTARVSAAMIAGADRAVLVADHSKFAASAFVRFAGWRDVDAVVSDAGLPDDARTWLAEAGVDVFIADPSHGP